MAVNLKPADTLLPIAGLRLASTAAGIKQPNRDDLTVMALAENARVAGIFTRNRCCAAPVQVCRAHLSQGRPIRALVINTGIANAATGAEGLRRARQVCATLAGLLGCDANGVLPFSTGVILGELPVERLEAALPDCVEQLAEDNWARAASAIMTTDTVAKGASCRVQAAGEQYCITGIAKGSGMIHPDMATMLAFIATDAAIAEPLLQTMVGQLADVSFHRVTVDGDTSTNDSFVLVATGGAAQPCIESSDDPRYAALFAALADTATALAQAMARDGEGATKFVTIAVQGGREPAECLRVGKAIAHSPLVKTALFASDPNLGRILAAIGNAGIDDLDMNRVRLWLGEVLVAQNGGASPDYVEADAAAVMAAAEIGIRVALGRGEYSDTVWTCDLSYDYVRINAEYRS